MDKNSVEQKVKPPVDGQLFCLPGPDGRCSVCADEGVAGRVLDLLPDNMARVSLQTGEQEVALDLLDDPAVGDMILVHVGVAIAHITAAEEDR